MTTKYLTLKTRSSLAARHPRDTTRIIAALQTAGYQTTPEIAAEAWNRFCKKSNLAEWFEPPDEDRWVVSAILEHCVCHIFKGGEE